MSHGKFVIVRLIYSGCCENPRLHGEDDSGMARGEESNIWKME